MASEKILLADSLATESCRLADRLATKLFFSKRTTPMQTERDRARSKMQGSWPFGPRRLCLRVNPPPRVQVPSLRFSFRDNLSFVGRRKYRTRCDCQFARHISFHMSPFQFGFEPSKCPSAAFGQLQRKRRNRRIRRKRFEGGRREGASSKEEESSKEPVYCFSLTRGYARRYGLDKPIKQ